MTTKTKAKKAAPKKKTTKAKSKKTEVAFDSTGWGGERRVGSGRRKHSWSPVRPSRRGGTGKKGKSGGNGWGRRHTDGLYTIGKAKSSTKKKKG